MPTKGSAAAASSTPLQPRRTNEVSLSDASPSDEREFRRACSALQLENAALRDKARRADELEALVNALREDNLRLRSENATLRSGVGPTLWSASPPAEDDAVHHHEENDENAVDQENRSPIDGKLVAPVPALTEASALRVFRVLEEREVSPCGSEYEESEDEAGEPADENDENGPTVYMPLAVSLAPRNASASNASAATQGALEEAAHADEAFDDDYEYNGTPDDGIAPVAIEGRTEPSPDASGLLRAVPGRDALPDLRLLPGADDPPPRPFDVDDGRSGTRRHDHTSSTSGTTPPPPTIVTLTSSGSSEGSRPTSTHEPKREPRPSAAAASASDAAAMMTPAALVTTTPINDRKGSTARTPLGVPSSQPKAAAAAARTPSWAAVRREMRESAPALYREFNERVFGGRLPADLVIEWSAKLQTTAGRCAQMEHRPTGVRSAKIELSEKVIDAEDRLRDTLAHEMCHAATWLLDGVRKPPHGAAFKKWGKAFASVVPGIRVDTCHNYEIFQKFRYACTVGGCDYEIGRQSKSVDVARQCCPRCGGKLALLGPFNRDGTPAKPRGPSAFAVYVKEHFSALKAGNPSSSHKELMGELGKRFREAKQQAATDEARHAGGGDEDDLEEAGIGGLPMRCVEIAEEDAAEEALAALRLS